MKNINIKSKEKMAQTNHKLLQEMRITKEFNVSCPSDKRVKVCFLDTEYHIDATNLTSLHLAEHIIHHLAYYVWFNLVFQRFNQYCNILYDQSGFIGHVLILRGRYEWYFSKMTEVWLGCQLVEVAVS